MLRVYLNIFLRNVDVKERTGRHSNINLIYPGFAHESEGDYGRTWNNIPNK